MDEDRSHMTERILDLTMEIIYLLTGEDCNVVKKTSGELLSSSSHPRESTMIKAPMKNNDKKIIEVIHKMIELLTGKGL
ncbi:oocyte zinc finger protein XlCOF29-like [Hyperolius riggenbachi]|uniref:oocyte zinc finger protein XlCOF29-like n=1 Tax=Hyperolius riggenbachi TaxID=752182 RepID=UPI0035A2967D